MSVLVPAAGTCISPSNQLGLPICITASQQNEDNYVTLSHKTMECSILAPGFPIKVQIPICPTRCLIKCCFGCLLLLTHIFFSSFFLSSNCFIITFISSSKPFVIISQINYFYSNHLICQHLLSIYYMTVTLLASPCLLNNCNIISFAKESKLRNVKQLAQHDITRGGCAGKG